MNNPFIKCEKVNKNNLAEAIKVQKIIFPNENGEVNLKDSLSCTSEIVQKQIFKYWLCKEKSNNIVGITGIYSIHQYPEDAWCGWFGILPEYRNKKYGETLFLWTMEKAKGMGFKYFRLYTNLIDNKNAVNLYRKIGMIEEKYTREILKDKYVIFSKSLISDKVEKWDNEIIFLKEQEKLYK